MTRLALRSETRRRAIRLWLLVVAALMFVTLMVGGATRLTESGLSIVEWKPVTGVMPPLDASAWQAEFDKYKAIPQYRERHPEMRLDEFKTIYWWEWTHRLLARLVGGVFLVPFVWFLLRGWVEPALRARLWTIFALGAALGAIGWWMVASGLSERVSVSQYRLAFHLTLACLIFAAIVWTAQGLAAQAPIVVSTRIRASALAVLVLFIVQIYLGALVAGLRAGLIYNTWPLTTAAWCRTRRACSSMRRSGAICSRTRSRCSSITAWWPMRWKPPCCCTPSTLRVRCGEGPR
jgi:cytochrome c oxidase assembly protein subunit 15